MRFILNITGVQRNLEHGKRMEACETCSRGQHGAIVEKQAT